MHGTDSLSRARQGDASSIADLLDRQLRPQGVTVTGLQTSHGLQLNLKGVTVEQQLLLRPYLGAALRQLQVPMEKVQVQGCTAKGKPIWQEELVLAEPVGTESDPVTPDLKTTINTQSGSRSRQTRQLLMLAAAIAGAAFAFWQGSLQLSPSPQSAPSAPATQATP